MSDFCNTSLMELQASRKLAAVYLREQLKRLHARPGQPLISRGGYSKDPERERPCEFGRGVCFSGHI